jgi:hypothetical protein
MAQVQTAEQVMERPVEQQLGLQGGGSTCAGERAAVGGTAEVKASDGTGGDT